MADDTLAAQFKDTAEALVAYVCAYGQTTLSHNRVHTDLLQAYEAGLIVGQAIGPDGTPPAPESIDGGVVA